jgi:hypothetical protein
METVNSPQTDEIFALANLLRTKYSHKKSRKPIRKLKGTWRELCEYLEEYRDVLGQ